MKKRIFILIISALFSLFLIKTIVFASNPQQIINHAVISFEANGNMFGVNSNQVSVTVVSPDSSDSFSNEILSADNKQLNSQSNSTFTESDSTPALNNNIKQPLTNNQNPTSANVSKKNSLFRLILILSLILITSTVSFLAFRRYKKNFI